MAGEAALSLGLFAFVWALLCCLAGALVTDAMLRATPSEPASNGSARP